MNKKLFRTLLSAGVIFAASASANAAQLDVTITNLTHGSYFTPLLVTAHDNNTHLFEVGMSASTALTAMAECGDISGLSTALGSADLDTIENPAAGLLNPSAMTTASLDTMNTGNTHLSIVAMLLPSNDAFVGLDALEIPATAGTYTYYLNAYDAGTEVNSELLDTNSCAPGMAGIPGAPGTGYGANGTGVTATESNNTVHVHRGVLGDTDANAGTSDLNSTVHRWQNPVAKVVVTVAP
ncbi:spondin domain-containing protein [Kaarinaea lacus]